MVLFTVMQQVYFPFKCIELGLSQTLLQLQIVIVQKANAMVIVGEGWSVINLQNNFAGH